MKSFQKHLDKRGIRRIVEKRYQKISFCERLGGLFKRSIKTLAKRKNVSWDAVLDEAVTRWNTTYVSRLKAGVPSQWNYKNFDQLIKRLYELEPVRHDALYNIDGGNFTEKDLAEIFKYKPGDKVLVSMRTVNKRMSGPVRTEHCISF